MTASYAWDLRSLRSRAQLDLQKLLLEPYCRAGCQGVPALITRNVGGIRKHPVRCTTPEWKALDLLCFVSGQDVCRCFHTSRSHKKDRPAKHSHETAIMSWLPGHVGNVGFGFNSYYHISTAVSQAAYLFLSSLL